MSDIVEKFLLVRERDNAVVCPIFLTASGCGISPAAAINDNPKLAIEVCGWLDLGERKGVSFGVLI